jgi:two-component system response regulator RegA
MSKLLKGPVVIIDNEDSFCLTLARSFRDLNMTPVVCADVAKAQEICLATPPALIVTELRMAGRWAFDFIEELAGGRPGCPIAIATVYPSVATAVRSVRMGFDAYLVKPVDARGVLDAVESGSSTPLVTAGAANEWPSLDRTIWEYINQVLAAAGTISEAARRLRLDRRSLRRMLAKYPAAF